MLLEEIFKVVSYCVKNVCIRGFSSPHFPAFGMNTEIYVVRVRKNTDQKTPNTDTFYSVSNSNPFSRQVFQFYTPWNPQKTRGSYFRRYRKETFAWIGFNLEFIKSIFTCYRKPLCNEISPFWNVCAIKFCSIFSWFSGLFNCIACKRLPGQILSNILFAGTLFLTY